MIEASENIDLVTIRRQNDLAVSQRESMPVLARAAQSVPAAPDLALLAAPDAAAAPETAAVALQAPPPSGAGDGLPAAGRIRLGVTAGLVVLLIVVWFWQRRASSAR